MTVKTALSEWWDCHQFVLRVFPFWSETEFYCPVRSRSPCSLGLCEPSVVLPPSNYQACYVSKTENHTHIVLSNSVSYYWEVSKGTTASLLAALAGLAASAHLLVPTAIPDPSLPSASATVCAAGRWTLKLILLENNLS